VQLEEARAPLLCNFGTSVRLSRRGSMIRRLSREKRLRPAQVARRSAAEEGDDEEAYAEAPLVT
jgi:hypothetical protein